MDHNADFKMAQLMDPIRVDQLVVDKAIDVLTDYYDQGKLKPLPDWDGGLLDGYIDVLGLNGRPIRMNRRSSMGINE